MTGLIANPSNEAESKLNEAFSYLQEKFPDTNFVIFVNEKKENGQLYTMSTWDLEDFVHFLKHFVKDFKSAKRVTVQ